MTPEQDYGKYAVFGDHTVSVHGFPLTVNNNVDTVSGKYYIVTNQGNPIIPWGEGPTTAYFAPGIFVMLHNMLGYTSWSIVDYNGTLEYQPNYANYDSNAKTLDVNGFPISVQYLSSEPDARFEIRDGGMRFPIQINGHDSFPVNNLVSYNAIYPYSNEQGDLYGGSYYFYSPTQTNLMFPFELNLDGTIKSDNLPSYATVSLDGKTLTVNLAENCTDGIDNDNDTLVDCADSDCAADPACAAPKQLCKDFDGDGFKLCDESCQSLPSDTCGDCDDTNAAINPGATEICTNGIDDNCNDLIDCADSDCAADPACVTPPPSALQCGDTVEGMVTLTEDMNGVSDDGIALDCSTHPGTALNMSSDATLDGGNLKILGNPDQIGISANGITGITIKNITVERAFKNIYVNNTAGINLDNIAINGGGISNSGLEITNSSGVNFDANNDGSTTKINIFGVKGDSRNATWQGGISAGAALYLDNTNGIFGTPLVIDPVDFSFSNDGITIGLNNVNYVTIKDFIGANAIAGGTTIEKGYYSKIGINFNRNYNDAAYSSNVAIQNVELKDLNYGIYVPTYGASVTHQNLSLIDIVASNMSNTALSLAGITSGFVTNNTITGSGVAGVSIASADGLVFTNNTISGSPTGLITSNITNSYYPGAPEEYKVPAYNGTGIANNNFVNITRYKISTGSQELKLGGTLPKTPTISALKTARGSFWDRMVEGSPCFEPGVDSDNNGTVDLPLCYYQQDGWATPTIDSVSPATAVAGTVTTFSADTQNIPDGTTSCLFNSGDSGKQATASVSNNQISASYTYQSADTYDAYFSCSLNGVVINGLTTAITVTGGGGGGGICQAEINALQTQYNVTLTVSSDMKSTTVKGGDTSQNFDIRSATAPSTCTVWKNFVEPYLPYVDKLNGLTLDYSSITENEVTFDKTIFSDARGEYAVAKISSPISYSLASRQLFLADTFGSNRDKFGRAQRATVKLTDGKASTVYEDKTNGATLLAWDTDVVDKSFDLANVSGAVANLAVVAANIDPTKALAMTTTVDKNVTPFEIKTTYQRAGTKIMEVQDRAFTGDSAAVKLITEVAKNVDSLVAAKINPIQAVKSTEGTYQISLINAVTTRPAFTITDQGVSGDVLPAGGLVDIVGGSTLSCLGVINQIDTVNIKPQLATNATLLTAFRATKEVVSTSFDATITGDRLVEGIVAALKAPTGGQCIYYPFTEQKTLKLHIIDNTGTKCPLKNGKKQTSCEIAYPGARVKAFALDSQFTSAFGTDQGKYGSKLDVIFNSDISLVGFGVTGNDGSVIIGLPTQGKVLNVAEFKIDGKIAYAARKVNLNSCDNNPESDDADTTGCANDFKSKFIRVNLKYTNGILDKITPVAKAMFQGSLLEVVYPEYTIWSDSVEVYPFILTSDSDWTTDICLQVPTGYKVTAVMDADGNILPTNQCQQTFISGETKVVLFTVADINSPEPNFSFTLNTKHKEAGSQAVKETKSVIAIGGIRHTTKVAQDAQLAQAIAPIIAKIEAEKKAELTQATEAYKPVIQVMTFSRNLGVGTSSADVKALQQYLNNHGYPVSITGAGAKGLETSYFGPKTLEVVKKFQKANGIKTTGFVGPLTRGVLNQ